MSGVIYGQIQSYTAGLDARAVYWHNRSALASLPSDGIFCRDMFHHLPLYHHPITSSSQLIAFASENPEEHVMGADWIALFEDLLRRLCWDFASVIETYCGHRFEWIAEREHRRNGELFVRSWRRIAYESYHELKEVPFGSGKFVPQMQ